MTKYLLRKPIIPYSLVPYLIQENKQNKKNSTELLRKPNRTAKCKLKCKQS